MNKLHLFIWLTLLIVITIPVHAQGGEPPIPAAPPDGTYVLDELDWLTSKQEDGLNSMITRLDNDGVAEVAVVTLNNCGSDKEAFRKSLFDTWGIGHKDDNDGLLILVCWYDGDTSRRSVEQLYGPGLKWILTSQLTDQTAQENFVPAFQQGKPGDGLVGMVRDYNVLLRTQKGSENFFTSTVQSLKKNSEAILFILIFVAMIVLQWGVNRFVPESIRKQFRREGDNDRGGFDGGRSDGGGGNSTRF